MAPVACVTWALDEAAAPAPNEDGRVQVLATRSGWPVALVDVGDAASADDVARSVRREAAVAPPTGWDAAARSTRPITVIVCTLGREPRLPETVGAVLGQDHEAVELLVVDNDPAGGQVQELLAGIDDPRLRIVAERRRGLSAARNTGLRHASYEVVASTDDDALPAPAWPRRIAAIFDRDRAGAVACVTGLVLPAVLETQPQAFFEEAGGFGKGLRAVHWSAEADADPGLGTQPGPRGLAFPFDGGFGSGNNMAFRAEDLRRLGGFDVALGAGSPALGGEDLDAFQRLFLAGRTVVYWPAAVVRHHHRADHAALRAQLLAYGVGMSAVVTKRFLTSPTAALAVLRRLPGGLRLLLDSRSAKNEAKSAAFPADLTRTERLGYLAGPFRLLWSRWRTRRARRRGPASAA